MRRRARLRARLRHSGRAGRLGWLRRRLRHGHRLRRRARLRERLRDRRRSLDLRRLHLELRALDSLHRACGRLLHLFLLCRDQPVELLQPRAGRFDPFLVGSVHRLAESTHAFSPLSKQIRQLATQPEQLQPRARVGAHGLHRHARVGANGPDGACRKPRHPSVRHPPGELDEEGPEHHRDAEQHASDDRVTGGKQRDSERQRGRGEGEDGRGWCDPEEARLSRAQLDRNRPGLVGSATPPPWSHPARSRPADHTRDRSGSASGVERRSWHTQPPPAWTRSCRDLAGSRARSSSAARRRSGPTSAR